MTFCLRVDLDYVPWDTPDAEAFGHGEPAVVLRLLDLARETGWVLHFFASDRVLHAFPSTVDAVLNDGHRLDWLCKHPSEGDGRRGEAERLLRELGHQIAGVGLLEPPAPSLRAEVWHELSFVCAPGPSTAPVLADRFRRVDAMLAHREMREAPTSAKWFETAKGEIRRTAAQGEGCIVAVRPQLLARIDPKLHGVRSLFGVADLAGLRNEPIRGV